MAKFDEFVDAVKEGAANLALSLFGSYKEMAEQDAKAFIEKSRADIEKWTQQLEDDELTQQDFQDLVEAKEALAELHALRQAGAAQAQLQRFRKQFIELVVSKAFSIFL